MLTRRQVAAGVLAFAAWPWMRSTAGARDMRRLLVEDIEDCERRLVQYEGWVFFLLPRQLLTAQRELREFDRGVSVWNELARSHPVGVSRHLMRETLKRRWLAEHAKYDTMKSAKTGSADDIKKAARSREELAEFDRGEGVWRELLAYQEAEDRTADPLGL